jgi:hypothetical protein
MWMSAMCNDQSVFVVGGHRVGRANHPQDRAASAFFKHMAVPHYFATTVWEATFWHGMDLRVYADDKLVEGHYLVAVANNIRHYAGGMSVLSPERPARRRRNGHVAAQRRQPRRYLPSLLRSGSGRHLNSEYARASPFAPCASNPMRTFPFKWMATPCSAVTKQRSSVKHRALKVLMPENALYLLKTRRDNMDLRPYLNRNVIFGALIVAGTLLLITLILIGWTSPRFSPDVGFAPADLTMIPAPTHTPAATIPTLDPSPPRSFDPTTIHTDGYVQINGTGTDGLRIRSRQG